MHILSTVLLALSLSTDAFAVAAGKGAAMKKPRFTEALRIGALFGAVEGLAPILGWAVGSMASQFVSSVDHWIAFGILALLGIKMIWECWRAPCPTVGAEPEEAKPSSLPMMILTAVGTSIDSIGVGISLGFMDVNILFAASCIGISTMTMATIGILVGHHVGCIIGKAAEAIGGLVLIGIGIAIVIAHTSGATPSL